MSKVIKITSEYIEECRREFEEYLTKNCKMSDGQINFTKSFGSVNRKATIFFTDIAWMKMQALIKDFDKEVAWHGVAHRGEDLSKDEYHITDILVYPQTVSGASVEMDEAKYDEWIRNNADDERFYNIGMQGHSHVNMATNPSSVDLSHQEMILGQLDDDMFYIFMIWNKSGSKNIKIYDLMKNVLFETSDITIEVDGFLKDAKAMVVEKKYTPPASGSYYKGGYQYNTGGVGYTIVTSATQQNQNANTTPTNVVKNDEPKPQTTVVTVPTSTNSSRNNDKKRKGKRKGKGNSSNQIYGRTDCSYLYDDEEYDSAFRSRGY